MYKAVAYARYSSENQRDESITAQLRAIREYARKNEIEIIQEYIDEAKSATTDDRPEFLMMMEHIKSGLVRVDYVLVHKQDRFARNRYDAAYYKRIVKSANEAKNARVVAVDQPLDDTPEGSLLESVLEGFAEYFSKNLAREAMKGLRENAYQARTTGGRPALGYDFDQNGNYVINDAEARTVKRIFDGVMRGMSYVDIIEALGRDGITTKQGKPFGKNSIHDILRNEKYAGVYVYMKGTKKEHRQSRNDTIRIEDGIPAIVTREEFDLVQELMNGRKRTTPRRRSDVIYILTGKVFCGQCGSAYIGKASRTERGKGTYYSYRCSRKHQTRACDNKYVNKEWLENTVLDYIQETIFNIEKKEWLAAELFKAYQGIDEDKQLEIHSLKKELADLKQKMDNLISAIESGKADLDIIGPRLRELKDTQTNKKTRLAVLENDQTSITIDDIRGYLDHISQTLADRDDQSQCREVVERYVDRITIYPDRVEIKVDLRLPGNVGLNGGSPKANLTLRTTCYKPTRPAASN